MEEWKEEVSAMKSIKSKYKIFNLFSYSWLSNELRKHAKWKFCVVNR